MRKLTVTIKLNEGTRESLKSTFNDIYSYEVLETLKIEWEKGIVIDLIECILKDGVAIDDLKYLGMWKIMSVLKSEGNKLTCLVTLHDSEEAKYTLKDYDFDLIFTTPSMMSLEKYTVSAIGENENLNKYIEILKTLGNIENMSFSKAAYQKHDILTVLTDKQRDILIAANHFGYYDYPRKINSEQLSKKVSIGKTTLLQHLRKAEGRIMTNILAGHPFKKM